MAQERKLLLEKLIKQLRVKKFSASALTHVTLALISIRKEDHTRFLTDLLSEAEKSETEKAFLDRVWIMTGAIDE